MGRKNGVIRSLEASRDPGEYSIGGSELRGSQGILVPEVADGVEYAQGLTGSVVELGDVETLEHGSRGRHSSILAETGRGVKFEVERTI